MWTSIKIPLLWSRGISILILKNIFIYLFLNWFLICPLFSLLLQDSGNRYTLNSIYKDESQCPAVQYKCRRGGRGRPLVWQRQDSDTFKGRDDTWWHGHYYKKWQGRENADHLLHFRPLNCSFNCSNLQFKCLKRSLLSLHFHCNHKMYDDRMTGWLSFKGYRIYEICFALGCPVRRQSCNTTSSDLKVNNVLSKETAYTYSMCSGRYYLSGGMQHIFKYHIHCIYIAF